MIHVADKKVDTAYLIKIDIDTAEASRSSFEKMREEAKHSADVCVTFNGETKEFTLAEFGKLLGFKSEIKELADRVMKELQELCFSLSDSALRIKRALEDPINRVGGLK